MEDDIRAVLIAPCAMNCRLCYAYQREKKPCRGCNAEDESKPAYCQRCRIKNCAELALSVSGFCFECSKFPCKRLKELDERYRKKYHMSMIGNLKYIKENGLGAFLEEERKKWTCSACGNILSVHRPDCPACKLPITATIGE
jgi:hypothetical protein